MIDVIKYETTSRELVGKYQADNIKLGGQLIVYPSQTAFFVRGGAILDEFTSGTYTLKTDNIPLLSKLINLPFGGKTPFSAEVWFVNQVTILDCKWGTPTPIQIEDPIYRIIVPVTSRGQYGLKISNPRLFLESLVGNMPSFSLKRLTEYLDGIILSKLTSIITQKLLEDGITILNINAHLESISEYAEAKLATAFADYGIEIKNFNIIAISTNPSDPSFISLKRAKDAATEQNLMREASDIINLSKEDYRTKRSFDVLESAARNTGGSMGDYVGIGAGLSVGSQIGRMVGANINTQGGSTSASEPTNNAKYYLVVDGERQGPFTFKTIKSRIAKGLINGNTLGWKKGLNEWLPLTEFEEFTDICDEHTPPPLPPTPPTPPMP